MRRALLYGHDETVREFVANLAPIERPLWRDFYAAIGVLNGEQHGSLIGGVVFSEYKPQFGTMELSAAGVSSRLFSIGMVRELGSFAFRQQNVFRISARTSARNARAIRLLKGLGFRHEGIKAHLYGPSHHASDWRILRPEWESRWGALLDQKAA